MVMSTLMVLLFVVLLVLAALVRSLRLVPLGSLLAPCASLLPQGPTVGRLFVHHAIAIMHVKVFSACYVC